MKNKKIVKSLNAILPDEQQKARMLNKILEPQKRKNVVFKKFVPIATLLCLASFCILIYQPKPISNPVPMTLERKITFTYQNICYQEYLNVEENEIGSYLTTLEDGMFTGAKIYQGKNDSIIVNLNGIYTEFKKC